MREQDFLGIEGFKEKLAHKIFTSIHSKIQSSSLSRIISASGTMGRGIAEKKLKPIFQKYPRILVSSESPLEKQNMLLQVDGIGKENAQSIVSNIPILIDGFICTASIAPLFLLEKTLIVVVVFWLPKSMLSSSKRARACCAATQEALSFTLRHSCGCAKSATDTAKPCGLRKFGS